jgi:RNA polymerase sigma-70 factor (ECF subfamily)
MVQVAISKMPEACRTIFLLRRMDELSLKEIASELNISTKTVENQLTKARKILAQYLKAVLILVLILMTMK